MKRLLGIPQFYNLYQGFIGADLYLKKFATLFFQDCKGKNILDLGCGTSNILKFIFKQQSKVNFSYLGIDTSKKYVEYAKKKFPACMYLNQSVCEQIDINMEFDIVISLAVMAALCDEDLKKMFSVIRSKVNKNTKIILSDMNYRENAQGFEKFLYKNERNSYVRGEQDYIKVLSEFFEIEKIYYWDKVYRIPYSKVIFECRLKD